uniref:UDENN FNIP1/2-type domain-containing protein n=1 Tax=Brugia timori TaxID=42155 RepID=A0A0R3QK17_9BILA
LSPLLQLISGCTVKDFPSSSISEFSDRSVINALSVETGKASFFSQS